MFPALHGRPTEVPEGAPGGFRRVPSPFLRGAGVAAAALTLALTGPGAVEARDVWTEPFPGLRLLHRTTADPLSLHVVEVDLCHPGVGFRATPPGEGRRRTSAFGEAAGVQVAINGAFYDTRTYQPIGLAMGNGTRWEGTADSATTGFLAAGQEGRVLLSMPEWVVRDPEAWMWEVVSGIGVLVRDGVAVQDRTVDHFVERHPRTGIGLSRDGRRLFLAVVDGRRPGFSVGVTTRQFGEILRDVGAWNAINLDGGGSTTLWVEGQGVVNRPSDPGGERVVANHVGVFARPAAGQPSLCCTPEAVPAADGVFGDLPTDHFGYRAALALREAGIATGCSEDPPLFCPDCRLKRDQAARMLVAARGDGPLLPARPTFIDVPADHWAYGYVERLAALGITRGCREAPRRFCPDLTPDRGQMAILLQRSLEWPARQPPRPTFADVPAGHPAFGAVEALAAAGVVTGCADAPRRFCPDRAVTRIEAAVMVARGFGLVDPGPGGPPDAGAAPSDGGGAPPSPPDDGGGEGGENRQPADGGAGGPEGPETGAGGEGGGAGRADAAAGEGADAGAPGGGREGTDGGAGGLPDASPAGPRDVARDGGGGWGDGAGGAGSLGARWDSERPPDPQDGSPPAPEGKGRNDGHRGAEGAAGAVAGVEGGAGGAPVGCACRVAMARRRGRPAGSALVDLGMVGTSGGMGGLSVILMLMWGCWRSGDRRRRPGPRHPVSLGWRPQGMGTGRGGQSSRSEPSL